MFFSFRLMTIYIGYMKSAYEYPVWQAFLWGWEQRKTEEQDFRCYCFVRCTCFVRKLGREPKKGNSFCPTFRLGKTSQVPVPRFFSMLLNLAETLAAQASIRAKWPIRPELILVSVAWSDKPLLTFEVLSTIIYTIHQTYFNLHQLTPPSKADNRMPTVIFYLTLQASEIASFLPKFNLRVFRRSEIVNLVHPLKVWYWQRFAVGLFRQIIKTNFIRGKQQLTLSF